MHRIQNFRQDLLSDEEAQEVTRLLSTKEKMDKWQPDLIPESISGPSSLIQDLSGPVSLNDSLGPPSLQEDSIPELEKNVSSNVDETIIKEPGSCMYDSTSSVDVSHDFDELTSSKMDASYSTCDSGLIGKHLNQLIVRKVSNIRFRLCY